MLYGQVETAYVKIIPNKKIEVPVARGGGMKNIYPNFFEAGYLSGRSFHSHQGYQELLKVIGVVREKLKHSSDGLKAVDFKISIPPEKKQELKNVLAEGDSKRALEMQLKLTANSSLYDNVIMLFNQYSRVETEKILGIIDEKTSDLRINKTNEGIIKIINNL